MSDTIKTFACACERNRDFSPRSCVLCRTKLEKPPKTNYSCTCGSYPDPEHGTITIINANCPRHGHQA